MSVNLFLRNRNLRTYRFTFIEIVPTSLRTGSLQDIIIFSSFATLIHA
jgi:hypothetical protein